MGACKCSAWSAARHAFVVLARRQEKHNKETRNRPTNPAHGGARRCRLSYYDSYVRLEELLLKAIQLYIRMVQLSMQ